MKDKLKNYINVKNIIISILLTIESLFIVDVVFSIPLGITLTVPLFLLCAFVLLIVLCIFLAKKMKKKILVTAVLPLLIIFSILLSYYVIYIPFKNESSYERIPCNATDFFSDKSVMVIIPHEDDDLNLVSGMIENYIECGSEVFPVFVTNGDYQNFGIERINEAIRCWDYLGVPESNVFFLGYGDQWAEGGMHIYNSTSDEPMTSHIGKTHTYGTNAHPAYHNGNLYTNRNYQNDLKDLITEILPDILFISDYDSHCDHKAVSLLSEKVMGEVLKEAVGYKPIIYKGYAYSTAWEAVDDYYSLNIYSTQKPDCATLTYNWEERSRLPVSTKSLSRSVFTSSIYNALSYYETKVANKHVKQIVNSDKVFWQRRTDSLTYNARIEASSGDKSLLNDFRILDNNDVNDSKRLPYDGVWIPEKEDYSKSISVELNEKTDISQIVLYDHPSLSDNITGLRIVFDDKTSLDVEGLNNNGSATVVKTNKKGVSLFRIEIISSEGEEAGLSEVEAFESDHQIQDGFIKLIDSNTDFVYDYITTNDNVSLSLYSSNNESSELSAENYSLCCDNEKIVCEIQNHLINIECPKNESGFITIREIKTGLFDTVKISNYDNSKKFFISMGQHIEKFFVYPFGQNYKNLVIYRLYKSFRQFLFGIKTMFV